ncbi:MAG: ArnT family glycosyltransferase [Aggregatilineales bacterium]
MQLAEEITLNTSDAMPDLTAKTERRQRNRLITLALLGFSAGVLLLLNAARVNQFDGLYGQDPYAYYDYGQQIKQLITHGQGLGYMYWPLGYPALISFGFLAGGVSASIAQMVSIVCAAGAAVFTGLLTVECAQAFGFARRWALLGGVVAWALITVSGQAVQSGIVVMSDMPGLFWATLSAWALTVYLRTQRHYPAWIALSAFALAWATMTRWQYAGLALPWALACLWTWRKRGTWQRRWKHGALAVGVGLLILTPQIIYTAQHPDPALRHEWLQGWSPANAFERDFVTADGTFHYDQPIAVYYLSPLTSPYYLDSLFVPVIGLGVLLVVMRMWHRKANALTPGPSPTSESGESSADTTPLLPSYGRGGRGVRAAILLFGWIGVQYGFLAGIPYQNIRFALSFFPPLIVFGGVGVAWLFCTAARLRGVWRIGLGAGIVGAIGYGLLATLLVASGLVSGFVANKDRDLAAVRWIESLIPEPNATVYMLDLTLTIQHYSTLKPVQIYYETPESMAARLPGDRPAYALFNVWTTEHQWQGKTPWIIYHWLLDQPGLTEIGQYSVYTLYRVN